jgi:REP element-mobilizing transposase RayT
MRNTVWNLRSRRSFRVLEKALWCGSNRFGVRLVQFSIQGNHIHLLAETGDTPSLARAMKGLSGRIAKGMNKLMGRHGSVTSDRYHSRFLRTPREAKHCIHYIRNNYRKHCAQAGRCLPKGFRDPYASESAVICFPMPEPETWLIKHARKPRPP